MPETDDGDVPPGTCRTCSRAGVECTFLRGYQKPGRPRGAATSSPKRDEDSFHAGPSRLPTEHRGHGGREDGATGSDDTITYPDFITDVTIPVGDTPNFTGGSTTSNSGVFNPFESPSDPGLSSWNPIISPSTNPGPSPQYSTTTSAASSLSEYRLAELTRLNSIPISRDMPLENVGPWSAMSEILSVYLRYLHSLFPLVHKPSFAQGLAMRKDQTDKAFAALLLGLCKLLAIGTREIC